MIGALRPVFAEEDTLMKRLLLVLGSVLSIAGASGLVVFGSAIVGVFDGVMTHRIVDPPEPLPASLAELGWVAMSGIALAIGLAVSCVATVMRDSQRTISLAGKTLHVVAGILLLIGTLPLLWGIMGAMRDFRMIATSAVAPTPESTREMFQAAVPTLTGGCAILVVGAVVLLVAGQVGVRTKPSQSIGTRSKFGVSAAIGSVVLGVVSSLLFVGVWLHGSALEAIFADAPSASEAWEFAQHLAGILFKSLAAFIAVGLQGVMQAVAAVFAPTSDSEQTPNNLA
jgi:hypothetical protein